MFEFFKKRKTRKSKVIVSMHGAPVSDAPYVLLSTYKKLSELSDRELEFVFKDFGLVSQEVYIEPRENNHSGHTNSYFVHMFHQEFKRFLSRAEMERQLPDIRSYVESKMNQLNKLNTRKNNFEKVREMKNYISSRK